jgi:hypothetical protein
MKEKCARFPLIAVAVVLCTQVHAQIDAPVTRDRYISCGGAVMAGLAMSQDKDNAGYRRLLNHFMSAAAALDPTNGPKEAAASSGRASYEVSTRWIDGIVGKTNTEEQKTAAVELYKKEINDCTALFGTHVSGLSVK